MLDRLRQHLADSALIPEGSRVLVGYSGGPDSTCLLHLLSRLGLNIVAGHLHHGQREEADKEMELCDAFCQEIGVPFASGRANVVQMTRDFGIGLEEAGRRARYSFFQQAAFRLDCTLVATAHTQSDHVETVLLNLARGSGLAGLAGIPESRGNIIRPLLPFTRDETRTYCEEHGLWTHDDPANEDFQFSRARIRHEVVPQLRQINSSFDANVARLASIVRQEDDFLNGMAAAALEQSEYVLNGDLAFMTSDAEVAFYRDKLTSLPEVLLKRSLRLAVESLGGQMDYRQTVTTTLGLVSTPKGAVTTDGGEVAVEWDDTQVLVRTLSPSLPFRYALTVPGETESDDFGWRFVAYPQESAGETAKRRGLVACLEPSKIRGNLFFRTAAAGDRMQPLGFDGHRKLSDLLAEAGLTLTARARLPIVCDMVGPLWAPGVCLDARAAATPNSANILRVEFGPAATPPTS